VGIHHAAEWDDYADARRYLEKDAPGWIELREIRCELTPASVYTENDCTPVFRELFGEAAGVLFTGGPDIPPMLYGEPTLLTTVIEDPPRHLFEFSLFAHLLGTARNPELKPLLLERPTFAVLGICLGMQQMSTATGGTMVQDIPSELYRIRSYEACQEMAYEKVHRSCVRPLYPDGEVGGIAIHPVRFVGASTFAMELMPKGGTVHVASVHHQAIEKLGQDLEAIATSLDGKVIEAIRHKTYPAVLGVQFHPEKSVLWDEEKVYRKRQGAPVTNYVASWFGKDQKARDFHAAYWRLVSRLLTVSASTPTKNP
jgi:putative glutamine amidotransferase